LDYENENENRRNRSIGSGWKSNYRRNRWFCVVLRDSVMADKRLFRFVHMDARRNAAAYCMVAPEGSVAEFKDAGRSLDQNAKFHAICSDVSKSGAKWMGKERTAEQWKVLFVSGHAIATGIEAEVVPGLEGEYVNIRESTAKMSKKRGASLIEYVLAWCAENGVDLNHDI